MTFERSPWIDTRRNHEQDYYLVILDYPAYLLLVPEYSRFPSLESRSSKFQGWTVDVQLYIITCNCPARMIEIEIKFFIQSRKNTLTASYNDNLSFSTVKIAVREAMILITSFDTVSHFHPRRCSSAARFHTDLVPRCLTENINLSPVCRDRLHILQLVPGSLHRRLHAVVSFSVYRSIHVYL